MFRISLGDAEIFPIVEVSGPRYRPEFVFPKITTEEISSNIGWMAPDLYDPTREMIAMVRQTNVIRTRGYTILIDTCVGDCKPRTVPSFNMLETEWLRNFRAAGLNFEEVDLVMCTHLHVDHVGWNTCLVDGHWVPTFSNARYVFSRRELEYWQAEHVKGRDSPDGPVFADSVLPLLETGQTQIVDESEGEDLLDGIWLEPTPGHSVGHVAVHLERKDGHVIFSGDIMHHPIQVREPQLYSRFCEDPAHATLTRRQFLEETADRDVLIVPAHFERGTVGRIRSAPDGFHYDFLAGGSTNYPQDP